MNLMDGIKILFGGNLVTYVALVLLIYGATVFVRWAFTPIRESRPKTFALVAFLAAIMAPASAYLVDTNTDVAWGLRVFFYFIALFTFPVVGSTIAPKLAEIIKRPPVAPDAPKLRDRTALDAHKAHAKAMRAHKDTISLFGPF